MARRRKRTFENETDWDPTGDPEKKKHWECSRCGEQVGPSQGIQDLNDPLHPKRRCTPCDSEHCRLDPVETMELPEKLRAPMIPPTVLPKPPAPKVKSPPVPKNISTKVPKNISTKVPKNISTEVPKPPSPPVPEHSSTPVPTTPEPGHLF